MNPFIRILLAAGATTVLIAGPMAQSTVVGVANEPPPRLTVSPPLPGPLAQGVSLPRGEHNVRIEVGDPEGHHYTAQTVKFTVPGTASASR